MNGTMQTITVLPATLTYRPENTGFKFAQQQWRSMGRQHTYFNSKVSPTFWETAWAWGLYVVLFILFTCTIVYILFYLPLKTSGRPWATIIKHQASFLTDISHELRTPLTLIASPVTEILENEPLSSKAREHLTLCIKHRTHAAVGKPDIGLPEDTE